MWNCLLKNKDYNSFLKNTNFRNYLSQSQLHSIKKIVDHRLVDNKLNIKFNTIKENKKEDNNLIIKRYLDKINLNNPLNDKLLNNSIVMKSHELSNNKYVLSFKIYVFLFALTSFTTSIGYYFYLQFKK